MTNARQKILHYLLQEQSATVEELSRIFKVTPANIRHHLSVLSDQGSVIIIGKKARVGKGRPSQVYAASQQTNQNNLEQLTGTLLSTLLANAQSDGTRDLMHEIARQMVSNAIVDKHNPTRRLYSSIRVLNRMGYRAHWEAHIEYPRIMLGHCPYMTILDHHPEICQMDAFVLQELLDTPVKQIEKLAANTRGLAECVFLLTRLSQ